MEIILSNQCESLTGSLGRGFGYFIVGRWSRKDVKFRYYSQRSRWDVPPDGHLRFILTCAILAQSKLHITDIRLPRKELREALSEAYPDDHCALLSHHCDNPLALLSHHCDNLIITASDVLFLKEKFGL